MCIRDSDVPVHDPGACAPVPPHGVRPPSAAVVEHRPGLTCGDDVFGAVHPEPAHRGAGDVLDRVLEQPRRPRHDDAHRLVPRRTFGEHVEPDPRPGDPQPGPTLDRGDVDRQRARARPRALSINIAPVQGGTRLRVTGPRIRLDVLAERPPGHEAMGVVVPWSPRLFQYTVKDVARPAVGRLWVDGTEHVVAAGESWAVLDHGRGRWPYSVRWNWGAGSGVVDGHVIGVQVGARWTDGTGSTENAPVSYTHL